MEKLKFRITASLVGTLLCAPVSAQVTQHVSVSSSGAEGNSYSYRPSISADGRFVAFTSLSTNLVPGDTNQCADVFVRDRHLGTTEMVSVDPNGEEAWEDCDVAAISLDGRFVLFGTRSTNLVPGDANGRLDALLRDRQLGTTEVASLAWDGSLGQHDSYPESISADGRFVTFESFATNIVPGDTNGYVDVFVRDRLLGTTECVSVDAAGLPGNGGASGSSISVDGRYVVFGSASTNLVAGDANGVGDVFLRDRQTGATAIVSLADDGSQGNAWSDSARISQDGRFVAFISTASNLVPGDTNAAWDIFVRDLSNGTTECVSRSTSGVQGNGNSGYNGLPSISSDGRYVTFDSMASNLVLGDANGASDIFVHDRLTGATSRVSVDSAGAEGNARSQRPAIAADGRFVAFDSWADNLVPVDTAFGYDVFVHDLDSTGFESICDPGSAGVTACPCGNAPTSPGHGCDNSSSTGGATLSATGVAYLSMDSLTFTTAGQRPRALSLMFQGDASISQGVELGQGVTCAGGALRRLYAKRAVAGSITAPGAGDPSVSAMAASRGDPISAGQARWYFVCYRDPVVLGGCPAASTFNATQTGRVVWSL